MITCVMSARQTTSLRILPASLSSLHSVNYSLFLQHTRGGVPPTSPPSRSAICQALCCLLHTSKPSIFMQLHTLLPGGCPLFPLFSLVSALFFIAIGAGTPSLVISRDGWLSPGNSRR